MRLLIIANFLPALALQSSAALLDKPSEAAPISNAAPSSGATTKPAVPQPPPENWEGKHMSWTLRLTRHGPPTFKKKEKEELPPKPAGTNSDNHKSFLKGKHAYIITKDYGQHVEGVTITHTLPEGSEGLPKTSEHYGIDFDRTKDRRPSHVVKEIVYAAKEGLPNRPSTFSTNRINQENLDKLRADWKEGSERKANHNFTELSYCKKIAKVGNKAQNRKPQKSVSHRPSILKHLKLKSQKKTAIKQRVPLHVQGCWNTGWCG